MLPQLRMAHANKWNDGDGIVLDTIVMMHACMSESDAVGFVTSQRN